MMRDIEFRISGWTPDTLPQTRLGEYLVELAKLYGESANVHFRAVRKGSAVLVSRVDHPAVPKVERRLFDVHAGHGPKDAIDAYNRLDGMLADDNATAVMRGFEGDRVIPFAGRKRLRPIDYGMIREETFVDGEIVRLGGRDQSVHVTLRNGDVVHSGIETDRATARRLGPLIFGPVVRLFGVGSWRRTEQAGWVLERLLVTRFEEIATTSLAEAIDGIRQIGGSSWHEDGDPIATLLTERAATGT